MKFQLVRQRSAQAVQIGKETGLCDVHTVELPHALVADLADGKQKFHQGLPQWG